MGWLIGRRAHGAIPGLACVAGEKSTAVHHKLATSRISSRLAPAISSERRTARWAVGSLLSARIP